MARKQSDPSSQSSHASRNRGRPRDFHQYRLDGGWEVLAGRTSADNDELSLRVAHRVLKDRGRGPLHGKPRLVVLFQQRADQACHVLDRRHDPFSPLRQSLAKGRFRARHGLIGDERPIGNQLGELAFEGEAGDRRGV